MNEPTIDELKSSITKLTADMSSIEVATLADKIQAVFDSIKEQKSEKEEDTLINEFMASLTKNGIDNDKERVSRFITELKTGTSQPAKATKKTNSVEPKYIHPDYEGETWSGRGPKPPQKWQDLIDKEKAKAGNESKKRNELLKPYLIKKE